MRSIPGISKLSRPSVVSKGVNGLLQGLSVLGFVYVVWVLYSVVAWVSHLGKRVPVLSPFIAAEGYPANTEVEGLVNFFQANLPAAFLFVLPHSFIRVPRLTKWIGSQFARIVYNVIAAASLHVFLVMFRPMTADVLFTMPFGSFNHGALSVIMLFYAFIAMMSDYRTYHIMGIAKVMDSKANFPKGITPRMDIITWMGYTTWKSGGDLAFILFSGLSILPEEVSLNDIIPRVVAAIYLRMRSQGFRSWVDKIDNVHHATWIIRGLLLAFAVAQSDRVSQDQVVYLLIAAAFVALILNKVEKVSFTKWSQLIRS